MSDIGVKLLKNPFSFLAVFKKGWKSNFLEQNTNFFLNDVRFARKLLGQYSKHVGTPCNVNADNLIPIKCHLTFPILQEEVVVKFYHFNQKSQGKSVSLICLIWRKNKKNKLHSYSKMMWVGGNKSTMFENYSKMSHLNF